MTYALYDGSFEGFLSAVFDVYAHKLDPVQVRRQGSQLPMLFAQQHEVHTAEEKVSRVEQRVKTLAGRAGVELLWKCHLSGIHGVEDALLGAIRYLLASGKDVFSDYGHPDVLELKQVEKKMRRERHRMTAFVRFQLGADELYYAVVEPDFDVLPLLIAHFQGRYADQRWLIFDVRRQYGIYYDLHQTQFVYNEGNERAHEGMLELKEDEEMFGLLWKEYFTSTGIKARRNMKLHLQHVPRRYWKYLPEKTAGL